jgi:hypothetical protein
MAISPGVAAGAAAVAGVESARHIPKTNTSAHIHREFPANLEFLM